MALRMSLKTRALIDRVTRVNHAGEFGANRIYQGQLAVLKGTELEPIIQHMYEQEKVHLQKFEELIPKYKTRPTILMPIWNVAGFCLGAGTALLGKEAAMACTVAVESVIGKHYNDQIRTLLEDDPESHTELVEVIKKFRDEELEHHDTGLQLNAEQAPFYQLLSSTIKLGCKAAIFLSERI